MYSKQVLIHRKRYLDYIKVFAIIMVILNHLPVYTLYQSTTGVQSLILIVVSTIIGANTSLLFMVSGALLLNKNEDYRTVIRKRVLRYLVIIITVQLIAYLIQAKLDGGVLSLNSFLHGVYNGYTGMTVSYWFLYAYLGFTLMLPILQKFAKQMSNADFAFIIIGHFVLLSIIPIVNLLLSINGIERLSLSPNFMIPFITVSPVFLPLVGYYINNCQDVPSRFDSIVYVLAFCGTVISCICTLVEKTYTGSFTQNYLRLFDYSIAMAIFTLFKKAFGDSGSTRRFGNQIQIIGSCTLGIYIFDPILKSFIYPQYEAMMRNLPTVLISIIWAAFSCLCGTVVTLIIRKIPVINKLISF